MSYRLFLDDVRQPADVAAYIMPCGLKSLYHYPEWTIARDLEAFKSIISEQGMPAFISFDHDLGLPQTELQDEAEITGVACARWLCDYAAAHNVPLPPYQIHSTNPAGRENIISVLESYKKISSRF